MKKYKKQFRLFDLYRFAVTGEQSNIKGIDSYECNVDCSTILIRYEDTTGQFSCIPRTYFCRNEKEIKELIHEVNKTLGTCKMPGRKKGAKYVAQ